MGFKGLDGHSIAPRGDVPPFSPLVITNLSAAFPFLVLTKVVVYAGIGWGATELIPIMFELLG